MIKVLPLVGRGWLRLVIQERHAGLAGQVRNIPGGTDAQDDQVARIDLVGLILSYDIGPPGARLDVLAELLAALAPALPEGLQGLAEGSMGGYYGKPPVVFA